ncbi:MAG TPA: hypothetical protein VHE55_12645 [Fimbriimonadaceae bacterium]|nr:hypothetical protein [Fimbriimonadaceae bacterium]
MKLLQKGRWVVFAAFGIAAVAFAAQASYRLVINGKPVSGSAIVVKGETYVPLKALQAAGVKASFTDDALQLTLQAAGGANQSGALEGGIDEWLFDGVWRFRVTSVKQIDSDLKGWNVGVELRNGTKADDIALSGTGFESLNLVLSDGTLVPPYNITDIRDAAFAQGAGKTLTLVFNVDDIGNRKPEKLLLLIKPDDDLVKYMRDSMKIAYTTKDPSFRVKLAGD